MSGPAVKRRHGLYGPIVGLAIAAVLSTCAAAHHRTTDPCAPYASMLRADRAVYDRYPIVKAGTMRQYRTSYTPELNHLIAQRDWDTNEAVSAGCAG